MYSFTVKSKVFQILTYIRQERPNEQYRNTVKDLLLPNTVSQKDEKPHTAGLDDTAIPHIKIKITEIPLEKSSIPEYGKPPCPPLFYIICNFFYWSSTGLLRTIKSFSDDIIMEYGLDKCAKAIFKRGRLADSSNIELDVNTIIQDLDQGGTYKYLGGTRETESSTLRSKRRSGKSTTAGSGWYSSRS